MMNIFLCHPWLLAHFPTITLYPQKAAIIKVANVRKTTPYKLSQWTTMGLWSLGKTASVLRASLSPGQVAKGILMDKALGPE